MGIMVERLYIIYCRHCKHKQQTIVRTRILKGNRKCFFCGKNIQLKPNTAKMIMN